MIQFDRGLEKVGLEQLKVKKKTISCSEAFLLIFFVNNITKLVSKLVQLATFIGIIV